MLGLSVAIGLAPRLGIFECCSIALLGIDGWRFTHPVVPGDTVSCAVHITGVRATSNGRAGILDREFVLTNQDGTAVQQGAIGLMVSRAPPAELGAGCYAPTVRDGRDGPTVPGGGSRHPDGEDAGRLLPYPTWWDIP